MQSLPLILSATFALSSLSALRAEQKFDVTIVDRQDSQMAYSYVIPGQSNAVSNTDVSCNGAGGGVNCSGTTTSSRSTIPSSRIAYQVTGATLSLQLPDGRLDIVNCDSKLNWTDFSKMNQTRRSCKVPLVAGIRAEFNGDKAKLRWRVSIDGKKFESETYKILAVLDKPQQ